MHLVSVLLMVTCVVNVEFVGTQSNGNPESGENENDEAITTEKNLVDHTFVALIDIVFTDSSKRTCTGSIIHENVVITAAHCFKKEIVGIDPELTASFVVIGTKKMFDTGYEQYLPIERVITHPKFSGWTADLSLVYTFAGMTSDKPGSIIPLAGEKTSTHVDSNVTVLSWGPMRDVDSAKDWISPKKNEKCDSTSIEDFNKFPEEAKIDNSNGKVTAILQYKIRHRSNYDMTSHPLINKKNNFQKERDFFRTQNRVRDKTQNKLPRARSQKTKLISRYLSGEERVTTKPRRVHRHSYTKNNEMSQNNEDLMINDEKTTESNQEFHHNYSKTRLDSEYSFKSYYKNWRRYMGTQQNQLTVEIFGFVNVQACKKLVEKAMPAHYDISEGTDVVCYATEDHFISDEDSGAPAVRRGQLVAVTVGGAEIDGDHVAVGMKMSCYCTWIADNLPNGDSQLQCCKNCCDVKHREDNNDATYKHKNKYLI